ncbi:MAG TPA: S41 family peptidase [Isosphaeraceae bacterium]|nr:S41 family peptidase [Isosphaeraceae bacterium]
MPRRNYFALAMIGSLSLFCWQASQGAKPKDEMLELYGLFVDAVEKVEANYVRPVSRRELLESALEGMLQNLDPHSSFINTSEWSQFRRQIEGKFGGIGIQVGVDQETGRLRVIAPMVGTPAYEAGILAGDQIVEIDGQTAEGMSTDKAVEVLTGRPGTEVKLSVLHEGSEEPETIPITRAVIDVPSILGDHRKPDDRWEFLLDPQKKIGYVRIASFIQNTAEDLRKVLDELKDQGMKGLILDLRDDPGGLLSAAVEVSDLFLDDRDPELKGKIVSTKGRNTSPKTYNAQKDSPFEELPLVVLVNQNSASASEIVSAALQDHHRATVVGQRTYGKGSVQNIFELDDGNSVLKLTVASYYRPSGENIHRFRHSKTSDKWGVSPDPGCEVKLSPSEYIRWAFARRDRDLAAGHRRTPASAPEAQKTRAESQPGSTQEKPQDQTASKTDRAKVQARRRSPGAPSGPFVDKQRDKALEVLRAKLAEAEKAKAA